MTVTEFGIVLLLTLLYAIDLLMLVRAILSFFPGDSTEKLENLTFMLTEPFIIPMRILLSRFDSIRTMPLDIPFFVTFLLISVSTSFLDSLL